jgi:uncharacterized membrane protein
LDLKEKAGNVFEREALRRELQAMLSDYLEDREVRALSWNELLYIFLTSAVFGSLVESLWCRVSNGFWERRTSVLFGDLSFAEAIGGTFLTVVLRNDLDAKPGDIFVKSLFWGTVLEYIMSWGEETFTGYRSWDYSDRAFNLNGRVCALYSGFWGALGVAWAKLIYPGLREVYDKFPERVHTPIAKTVIPLLVADIVVSIIAKDRFTDRRAGVPATNAFDEWVDAHFPDEMIIRAYPNSVKVDRDGNSEADTLNGTNARALEEDTLKAKVKALDHMSEEEKAEWLEALRVSLQEKTRMVEDSLLEKTYEAGGVLRENLLQKSEELQTRVSLTAPERTRQVLHILSDMFLHR